MKINFLGLLTVVFIALKLTNYIDWSWWLVLLPLYGGIVFTFVLFWVFAIFLSKQQKIPINDSADILLKSWKQSNKK